MLNNTISCIFTVIFIGFSPVQAQNIKAEDKGIREKISLEIVNNLVDSDYEAARKDFVPLLKDTLTAEQLESSWENFIASRGALVKILSTSEKQINKVAVVAVKGRFREGISRIEVSFNGNNQVVGLKLSAY